MAFGPISSSWLDNSLPLAAEFSVYPFSMNRIHAARSDRIIPS